MTGPRDLAKLHPRRGRGHPVCLRDAHVFLFPHHNRAGATMDRALFQRLAEQCRELMPRARNKLVREQLLLWAEEFSEQADPARLGEPAEGDGD